MKNLLKKSALICVFCGLLLSARSQILVFGSGQTLTGTTNSSAVDTNTVVFPLRPDTFNIAMPGALVCTGAVANMYLSTSTTSVSNALLVGSWQGSGFNSTNVSTSRVTTNAPVYLLLQVQLGTNAPLVYNIYGP